MGSAEAEGKAKQLDLVYLNCIVSAFYYSNFLRDRSSFSSVPRCYWTLLRPDLSFATYGNRINRIRVKLVTSFFPVQESVICREEMYIIKFINRSEDEIRLC